MCCLFISCFFQLGCYTSHQQTPLTEISRVPGRLNCLLKRGCVFLFSPLKNESIIPTKRQGNVTLAQGWIGSLWGMGSSRFHSRGALTLKLAGPEGNMNTAGKEEDTRERKPRMGCQLLWSRYHVVMDTFSSYVPHPSSPLQPGALRKRRGYVRIITTISSLNPLILFGPLSAFEI